VKNRVPDPPIQVLISRKMTQAVNNNNNPQQISNLLKSFLKVEFIQEAFNQIIVHREDVEKKRIDDFQEKLGE
jgi:hypothetical protein